LGSFKAKMHQNRFRPGLRPHTSPWELLRRSPDPLVGWGGDTPYPFGRGYPLPIPLTLDAFGVSISAVHGALDPRENSTNPALDRPAFNIIALFMAWTGTIYF